MYIIILRQAKCYTLFWTIIIVTNTLSLNPSFSQLTIMVVFDRDLKPSNIFLAEDGSISVGKLLI